MLGTGETTPMRENGFIRSKFVAKRLKRLRIKTKSLTEGITESYNQHSPEPLSLQDFDSGITDTSPSLSNEEPVIFKCCTPIENKIESSIEEIVSDLVNSSFKKTSPRNRKCTEISIQEEESPPSIDQCESNDSTFWNEPLPTSVPFKDIRASSLLEEIEEALPEKYSLKRILHCPYSVPIYRTMVRLNKVPVRNFNQVDKPRSDFKIIYINKELERLQIELNVQETLLNQSKKALAASTVSKSRQTEYLEAEKALLIAYLRCEAVKNEVARLKLMNELDLMGEPKSGLANIKEIVVEIENPSLWSSYQFTCVAIEGENVRATPLENAADNGKIYFRSQLHFYNLRPDFIISIFIYGINTKEVKSKSSTSLSLLNKHSSSVTNLGHSFTLVGSTELNLSHMKYIDLVLLTKVQKLSNTIKLHVKGDVYFLEYLYEGFLNVKRIFGEDHDNGKKLTWERKWYILTGMGLQGWNYPSQQNSLPPADTVLISDCLSTVAEPVSTFSCARPNTFTFVTRKDDQRCQIFCNADSEVAMFVWCRQINQAINILRTWKN